jgi:hypothetical protein
MLLWRRLRQRRWPTSRSNPGKMARMKAFCKIPKTASQVLVCGRSKQPEWPLVHIGGLAIGNLKRIDLKGKIASSTSSLSLLVHVASGHRLELREIDVEQRMFHQHISHHPSLQEEVPSEPRP